MHDEALSEPPPPNPQKVAMRAVVLSAVACRGFVEGDRANLRSAADLAKRSHDWLRELGLEGEVSEWETRVLASPFGKLAESDRISASWLSEGMLVLAWALGRIELPGFDQQCDPAKVANSLGFLQPAEKTVLENPLLREPDVLGEYNEFVYNLHWRIRDFSLHRNRYDFESLARKAWGDPVLRYGLKLKNSDICIGDLPLIDAKDSDRQTVASITRERHRASNWLIGYASENFYEVTTDT